MKSLLVASEIGGASNRDLATPLFTIAAIAEARLSDVLRNPVNALATLSDIADTEFSEIARAPVKTLPTTSEGTTLRSGDFPAPLLMQTAIATTSDMDFATPLVTTSEIVDPRFSDVVLNPVKALPTTSEGTTLRSGNFPAPLLSETAIETTSDMDFASPLVTTSEIVDPRFSDVVLNPVKALPTMSEGTTLSSGNFPPPLLSETAIETTSDMDFAAPLATTSEIAEARLSDVVLNAVKTLDAASDTVGASASVLNPVKTLPTTSEGTTLSNANFPAPLLMLSLNAEATLSAVLRNA